MANTSSAKKKTRQIERRTEINNDRRKRVRTFLKKAQEAIANGNVKEAQEAFIKAQSETVKGANSGIMHKRTASRKIGRLAQKLKEMATGNK